VELGGEQDVLLTEVSTPGVDNMQTPGDGIKYSSDDSPFQKICAETVITKFYIQYDCKF
jgi:hypothetical protein